MYPTIASNMKMNILRDMWRTVQIWRLLRKLDVWCRSTESRHHDHGHETGHAFRATRPEIDFIQEICAGDHEKMARYKGYISIAANNMKFLSTKDRPLPCPDCGCLTGPATTWMCLNDAGREFLGFFDLCEYILIKYKMTWTLLALPIATFVLGLKI